jgi:hypothetical protein
LCSRGRKVFHAAAMPLSTAHCCPAAVANRIPNRRLWKTGRSPPPQSKVCLKQSHIKPSVACSQLRPI